MGELRGKEPKTMRTETPHGPVWVVPDNLPEKAAKHAARLDLLWPDLEGFDAAHMGPGRGGAWLIRAPRAALEACGLPTGSAAEHPVAEGTVWPPLGTRASQEDRTTTSATGGAGLGSPMHGTRNQDDITAEHGRRRDA